MRLSNRVKAVFLDRDGVVNELVYFPDQGIIDSPFIAGQFHLCPGVPEAVKKFQSAGYKVIIVSNQPGIAKGHMTLQDFQQISNMMKTQLWKEDAFLDGEYYCLHHPEAKIERYRADCACRKPKPGLIFIAARDLDIDVAESWYIGDNLTDMQAGRDAGCRTLLIGKMRCELCNLMYNEGVKPEAVKPDLLAAADFILKGA
jgi:D-glycero-D-manno-heptose 1,7-bisphosphate phosphatase